jgi:site-specific DNA-methyltransferase (adenine-specific)
MLDFGFYNMDCMQGMKEFPDNYFDLAIVDPPYGGGFTEGGGCQGWFAKYHQDNGVGGGYWNRFGGRFDRYKETLHIRTPQDRQELSSKEGASERIVKKIISWDIAPKQDYFEELFRVSRNQIIWGGNYFNLPPTRCFVIWKKLSISESFSMAMAEYAWTSFNDNAKIFECAPQGKANDVRFHPTQKPIALYEWLLNRYAKDGDIILDTHVGSASSLIACRNTNHKYVGFEIDEEYYRKAKKRLDQASAQMNIFDLLEEQHESQI